MTTGPDPGVYDGDRFVLHNRKGVLNYYRVEAVAGAETLVGYVTWDDDTKSTVYPWRGDKLVKLK